MAEPDLFVADRRAAVPYPTMIVDVLMTNHEPRFDHSPVMLDEIVDLLAGAVPGVFVDGTLGGAGHSRAVLEANPGLTLHGFDHDPSARTAASEHLAPLADRVHIHPDRFDRCSAVLRANGIEQISAFLLDLGVSSPQLDRAERGFSYRHEGPLDMRMNPEQRLTAADVVNDFSLEELVDVLRSYGDERHAVRIARAIVAARPVSSTAQLADVVAAAVPAATRRQPGHPAKRSFQAIRIEVNDELGILERSVTSLVDMLAPGGMGLVLTYHSGEDRIVKDALRTLVEADDLPGMPKSSPFEWLFRGARTPTEVEVETNPRARSARLRAIRRLTGDSPDTGRHR